MAENFVNDRPNDVQGEPSGIPANEGVKEESERFSQGAKKIFDGVADVSGISAEQLANPTIGQKLTAMVRALITDVRKVAGSVL